MILDEDRRSTKVRRGYRSVELPEALVARLEKIAKNRNSDIGEVIKTLAKGQK